MKKTLSALFIMLATTMATANAQEAKMVSGKIRCTNNSEVTLPEGMKFTMHESGMRKSLTPIRPLKAAADEELVTIKVKAICTRKPDGAVIFNKDWQVDKLKTKDCKQLLNITLNNLII